MNNCEQYLSLMFEHDVLVMEYERRLKAFQDLPFHEQYAAFMEIKRLMFSAELVLDRAIAHKTSHGC